MIASASWWPGAPVTSAAKTTAGRWHATCGCRQFEHRQSIRPALRFLRRSAIEDHDLICRTVKQHGIRSAILSPATSLLASRRRIHASIVEITSPRRWHLWNALLESEVRCVVSFIQCRGLRIQEKVPIPEDASMNPISPYAEAKLFVEQGLRAYSNSDGQRSVSLRYFNAAGWQWHSRAPLPSRLYLERRATKACIKRRGSSVSPSEKFWVLRGPRADVSVRFLQYAA